MRTHIKSSDDYQSEIWKIPLRADEEKKIVQFTLKKCTCTCFLKFMSAMRY